MKKGLVLIALLASTVFATGAGFDTSILLTTPTAEDSAVTENNLTNKIQNNKLPEFVIVDGVVKEINDNKIVIITDINAPDEITILNVGDAYYVDMLTGNYTDINSVKAGELISAYCSPIAPMIYPPQLGVQMILVNKGKEGAAAYRFITGEKSVIENSDTAIDRTGYASSDGGYIVWFYEDSNITDNMGNKLNVNDITEGMEILVWCDMTLTSYPAQVNAKKTVVLSDKNEDIASDNDGSFIPAVISGEYLVVDGDMVFDVMEKNKAYTTEQNAKMYPVRTVAEALGFTVDWKNGTVTIFSDNMSRASFNINEASYTYIRAFEFLNEGNTFQLKNGCTYAPQEFFERVFDCHFE